MKKLMLLTLFSLFVYNISFALPSHSPTGLEKSSIKIVLFDKKEITLDAFKPDWQQTMSFFANNGKMTFSLNESIPTIKSVGAILLPFSLNDIPGGKIYLLNAPFKGVYYFESYAEKSNIPFEKYVVLNSQDCRVSKVKKGTLIELNQAKPLTPGCYVVFIANNQYVWSFIIEGQPQPEKKPASPTQPATQPGNTTQDNHK